MNTSIADRLAALRSHMAEAGIQAVIIPQADPHQSEYIAAHWQTRRYFSGFTGSAGDLVVTADKALLWTDSRYFLQAAAQLAPNGIILMKDGLADTPSITQWLCDNLQKGQTVGIDGFLFSHAFVTTFDAALSHCGITLVTDFDPIDSIWIDRPDLPKGMVFEHELRYAGESAADKIAKVLAAATTQEADAVFLTALDEIAWTLNIRCDDVNCSPVTISYLYLSPAGCTLFVDPAKLSDAIVKHLTDANVIVAPYSSILPFLEKLEGRRVLADKARLSHRLWSAMRPYLVSGVSPVALLKACKNDVQVKGVRDAMVRDGIALVKSFIEIEKRVADGTPTTEMDVADILVKYRSASPMYVGLSFETIAGYAGHGAIVHYEADEESNATLHPSSLLLVDSGAQYYDGTTDITRTIALGTPTAQEKSDFTLVMKGHIALGTVIYPEGTRGAQLDALARQFLWKHGLSYLHGTGHGVGHFLNVHEGPQSIRLNDVPTHLMPGMITSNEPGLYREGIHGIRCENLVLTVPAMETEFGKFLRFETLTLFPFDRSLFDLSMMSREEIEWVDAYHREVYDKLAPGLDAAEQQWLREKTLPLEA